MTAIHNASHIGFPSAAQQTAPAAPYALMLADDGIIDLLAVEIAAQGMRPVALTRAERQLAAARILARGGTADLISKRLHVSGSTALILAARCQGSRLRPVPKLEDTP